MTGQRTFEAHLKALIVILWHASEDWTYKELGERAGVSRHTCSRLLGGKTRSPHLRTVWLIARACGFEVTYESKRITMRATAA